MRAIVAGAGEIGSYVAQQISAAGHDVTVIDNHQERIQQLSEDLDVRTLYGSAASASALTEAEVAQADLVAAVTGSDETNIVCASVAGELGAARTIARVDEVLYRKAPQISYGRHFRIDALVSPEMLAALDLASRVRSPGALAVEHFAQGALEMQQLVADRGADHVGKPLRDVSLPEGVRIGTIKRADQLIIPMGADVIEHGDLITIIGKTEEVAQARAGFESAQPKTQKVVIMGGGHTTLSLVRRLHGTAFKLTIIECDQQQCQRLAGRLPAATILHGDGTNLAFLKEERVDNADVFISTTGSDEANIMGAMQGKNLGVKKLLVVIHRPDYADLVETMGIDRAVSPRAVMAQEVLSFLAKGSVSSLATLEDGQAEILELVVEGEDFVGQRLRELSLPGGSLVLTCQRGSEILVPHAQTEFQLGDTVLIVVLQQHHKKLVRLVTGR